MTRNIEAFLESSQNYVSGEVHIKLLPYRFELQGITSENDLMNPSFGSYGEMNKGWNAAEAKGFIKLLSNSGKIAQEIHSEV